MSLLETITLVIMIVSLFGLIVPVFPGLVIIWLAALIYGLIDGFSTFGIFLFVVITLLAIVGSVVDNILMAALSRQNGAAWSSVVLGSLAGLVGTVIFPPLGGLIAAPAVVLLLEYRRQRNWQRSWQVVKGLITGWGLSFLAFFAIGAAMITLWLIWAWKG